MSLVSTGLGEDSHILGAVVRVVFYFVYEGVTNVWVPVSCLGWKVFPYEGASVGMFVVC